MPEWIGKTIGKVRIEKLLARGGMAEVYLGTHLTLGRPIAVKLLHSYIEEEPLLLERFHREARVVAGLRHPNIVQILDFDTIEGHPYIVMEYLKGPTLAAYLRRLHQRKKRSPQSQVVRLLNGLATALDYAHGRGVIHRDIKPANILLDSKMVEFPLDKPLPNDVEAVLTDFGLVRLVDATTHTTVGMLSGTPLYMSPEQALGETIDHRTDIYALGIVLYEMLAGSLPFQADSTLTILHMHAHATPLAIPGISAKIQAVVNCALAKNPADRYQTSWEMASDFARAAGLTAERGSIQEPIAAPIRPSDEPSVTVPPTPISLPADLLDLLSHDSSSVRKLAVRELVALLEGKHYGLARAAEEKLREIAAEDDSLTLRRIAVQVLSAHGVDGLETPEPTPVGIKTPLSTEIQKEPSIAQPMEPQSIPEPAQSSLALFVERLKEVNPLPRLTQWKITPPKLNKRLVGGVLGIAIGVVCLVGASRLILNGIPIVVNTSTATITQTQPPSLAPAPILPPTLTQTSLPTSTQAQAITTNLTRTLTATPTATRTLLPLFTAPTNKPRPTRTRVRPTNPPPTKTPKTPSYP
jgi:serine/threonine protein kinase